MQIRLPITLRLAADEPSDPYSLAFFQKILSLTREDIYHQGNWSPLEVAAEGYTSPADFSYTNGDRTKPGK